MEKDTILSSFGKWIIPMNLEKFFHSRLEGEIDRYTKKLTTVAFLKLLVFAQLNELESLRAISDCLINDDFQKELGFESISASQLSRKNNELDTEMMHQIFAHLVGKIRTMKRNGTQEKWKMPIKLVDSSTITLNKKLFDWAKFRKTKSGIKIHLRLVLMEKGQVYPEKVEITNAKPHDKTKLSVLVEEKDVTYVFDRGYLDYRYFEKMTGDDIFLVSRLKKNSLVTEIASFDVDDKSPVLSEKLIQLGQDKTKLNHYYRMIEVNDTKGNRLILITNRFDITAKEISNLYRSRWEIELFFKWIKQHVVIKHFYGISETAVKNQIYCALIVFCLHVLVRLEMESTKSWLQICRWLRATLWKPSYIWIRRFDERTKT